MTTHTLPSLNIPALTTETALLIKFMREQARAKSAGRELTYAILPCLLLSVQWLRISLISNQPGPPQISHSHTQYYNSSAIPGPGPRLGATEIPAPLRTDAELSEHHRVPRDSWGEGLEEKVGEREGREGGEVVQQVDG